MKCPVCTDIELEAAHSPKDTPLFRCPHCGGLWADVFWLFANNAANWNSAEKTPSELASPRTGKPMTVIEALNGRAPVHREIAGTGAWFGKHELALLTSGEDGEPWLEQEIDEPEYRRQLGSLREAVQALETTHNALKRKDRWPGRPSSVLALVSHIGRTVRLAIVEPEILIFGLLQVVVVAAFYLLWAAGVAWLTESWSWYGGAGDNPVRSFFVLIAWGVVCPMAGCMLLGVLRACMAAARFLRSQGRTSSTRPASASSCPGNGP